jgi:predicted nucleotidyltransferase
MKSQRSQQILQRVITPDLIPILQELKQSLVQKYPQLELRLFGSTARGDATGTSDIDLFIQIPEVTRAIEEDLFETTYEFELKYDCVFDVIILVESLVNRYADSLPIYQNILREGIIL